MKYVYLLRAGVNHYKVGVALNVTKRIRSIQTSNALSIEIVTVRLVDDAYKLEQEIHQQLHGMSTGGGKEWFKLTAEEALEIAIAINKSPEIDITEQVTLLSELNEQRRRQVRIEAKLDRILDIKKENELESLAQQEDVRNIKTDNASTEDPMIKKAAEVIVQEGKASTSLLQRKLSIGYGRAARIMEYLEKEGIVSELEGIKPRVVLKDPSDLL